MTAVHEGPVVETPAPGVRVATVKKRATAMAPSGDAAKSPTELIEFAIANKLPAAELKELVGLHERMEDRITPVAWKAIDPDPLFSGTAYAGTPPYTGRTPGALGRN